MSQIILSTKTVTTDAQASMTLVSTGYTTAMVSFTNPSLNPAHFRIMLGTSVVAPETTVEAGTTVTLETTGLTIGSSHSLILQREEFGSWLPQGNALSAHTKSITEVNTSTSSEAALLSWTNTHTAVHRIDVYNKTNLNSTLQEISSVDVNSSTNKNEIIITSLSNQNTYITQILVLEGGVYHLIKSVEFTPSELANLNVDAVFATYVELSYDDGDVGQYEDDDEAEFRIWRSDAGTGADAVMIMDWTPDTTKTFTDTGLSPGVMYQYILRRRGMDGSSVTQDSKTVTTKTTQVTIGEIGSKTLGFNWLSAYDSAAYTYKINGVEVNTSEVSAMRTALSPDTDYTFEVFIREQGQTVLMSSITQKTDKSSFITLNLARHTEIYYNLHNMSTQGLTSYYVANANESIRSSDISMEQGIQDMWLRGFTAGSTHNISLFRKENGIWVKQQAGDGLVENITVTTKSASISTSVASTSALIKWNEGYEGALYEINVYYSAPSGTDIVPDEIISSDDISNSGGQSSAIITGLEMDSSYWAILAVTETNTSGVPEKVLLRPFNFDTSAGATLLTGEVKASIVQLSWDAGEVGEADGIAEFKVRKQEVSVGTWTDATSWLPHDTNSFTKITGLKAGTAYKFELVRLGLGGNEVSQATVSVSTKTSTLVISGTASSSIDVQWTELYPGAQYQLVYTAENGTPETFGGGPISQTSALLEGLESSTKYVVELYAVEEGVSVGLSTQKLGSAASAETGTSTLVIAGTVAVGVVAVGLIIYKVKAASTAAKALV